MRAIALGYLRALQKVVIGKSGVGTNSISFGWIDPVGRTSMIGKEYTHQFSLIVQDKIPYFTSKMRKRLSQLGYVTHANGEFALLLGAD